MKGILRRKRHEKQHNFLRGVYTFVAFVTGLGAFVGMGVYVFWLFAYRRFDQLPEWILKVLVPKTSDGSEPLYKFTDDVVAKCNLAALIIGSITVVFAIVSWIIYMREIGKARTVLLVVTGVISVVGGICVLLKWAIPLWLKIVWTAVGSIGWAVLVQFNAEHIRLNVNKQDDCDDEYEDKTIWWSVPMGVAMLAFTAACWVYVGAANWWC